MRTRTYGNQMIYLITRIGWPPAVWLQFLHASLVPPLYALFPPRVPPRDEILIADPKTSIKYPRPEVMRLKRSAWGLWRYLRATVVIIYTIFLFVISFFIFDPAIPSPQKTAPK
ncbi:hypothetical protein B0A55_01715 [Friedmanniomyces simplex]|uniref:Uncharacterized protein n=1 Tax=Friedmanniomyces simplex TaxID=329884 RepID=A0A4V5NII5_9PEZI|nr:hypothetical protein B0A55_01715 [Friedmanniomyces simplex]